MFNKNTLMGQIQIVLLLFPISFIMSNGGDNVMCYLGSIIRLIIPLIVFCILFGFQQKGTGVVFRIIRIGTTSLLWFLAWDYWLNGFLKYSITLASDFSDLHDISFDLAYGVITASFDVVGLSLAVILSNIAVAWIKDIIKSGE